MTISRDGKNIKKLKEKDMKIFLTALAERQWRNGHLVEIAKNILETGKLDLDMLEPSFIKKMREKGEIS